MNEERRVPLYLFTGFIESGKTKLILDTLSDKDFNENEKTLLLCCEQGIEEYDKKQLEKLSAKVVYIDLFDELNVEYLTKLDKEYKPERIMMEYNGTWSVTDLLDVELPLDWLIVQIVGTVDATTFENYIANMRSFMYEQLVHAGMVVFNRCDSSAKKSILRGNVKAINPGAQIVYEDIYGNVNQLAEDELPFDMNAKVIEIKAEDYGLWYMDALDNPFKYSGKAIKTIGRLFKPDTHENILAFGRHTMVCCEDDVAFIGLPVHGDMPKGVSEGDWVEVVGEIRVDFDEASCKNYATIVNVAFKKTDELEQQFVYFS